MRIVLHTGKGGVGKTTVSAATAIAAARAGHRTLLLSTDPAHSVSDALAVELGSVPTAIPGVAGLWAAQVDTRARFEQAWSEIRDYLVTVLAARGMEQVQAEELTVLPGADEIFALLEVHRFATGADFDVIVVDSAPSGESLKLLALPETLRFYGDRLMGAPARLLRAISTGFAGLAGRSDSASSGPAGDAFGNLLDALIAARELLADSAVTGIRMVLTPERLVVAEARRLRTALALHGFAVEGVVVNRVLPASVGLGKTDTAENTFFASWRAAQHTGLSMISESFGDVQIRTVTLSAAEPVGVPALACIALELFDGSDPVADPVVVVGLRSDGAGGHYRLLVSLPLAQQSTVELSRAGDDLVVTVGPHRRRIALPSTLQRCQTQGASFEGDTLVVDFAPDPQLWPSSLPVRTSQPDIDRVDAK